MDHAAVAVLSLPHIVRPSPICERSRGVGQRLCIGRGPREGVGCSGDGGGSCLRVWPWPRCMLRIWLCLLLRRLLLWSRRSAGRSRACRDGGVVAYCRRWRPHVRLRTSLSPAHAQSWPAEHMAACKRVSDASLLSFVTSGMSRWHTYAIIVPPHSKG
eukprot:354728-Chlamydomonas_euryale.AAC.4